MQWTLTLATALVLPSVVQGASSQLYFSPPVPHSSSSSLSLTAPQTNAVLAYHLGVSSHVDFPLGSNRPGHDDWQRLLDLDSESDALSSASKFVVVVECPKGGSANCVPGVVEDATEWGRGVQVPNLNPNSYLASLALHLYRFAHSLAIDQAEIAGLNSIVEDGLKRVAGWQGWVGKELAGWIGYDDRRDSKYGIAAARIPESEDRTGRVRLNELDFLDESARQLGNELYNVVDMADSFERGEQVPKAAIVHLKGLREIAAKYSTSSREYETAHALVQRILSASIASHRASAVRQGRSSRAILLTLAPHSNPLLRKRQPWLHPFESPVSRYVSRTRSSSPSSQQQQQLHKRSVFVSKRREDEDDKKKKSEFVVPSSSKCFKSLDDLNNQTASCLDRGHGVRGISTKAKGGDDKDECWVCKCGSTVDEETGKKTSWAGEGCEKVDLSSSFSLLFFSSLGLVLILIASVTLLYKVGSVELPGTLSAVGGTGGGHIKRD
ncbi:hypothetical protein JCM3766R1_003274 [Sporobolomyces carnicolor]